MTSQWKLRTIPLVEKLKKLKDDIAMEIKNDTFGRDSSPLVCSLGLGFLDDDASIFNFISYG